MKPGSTIDVGRPAWPTRIRSGGLAALALAGLTLGAATTAAADQPQYGQAWNRNLVSNERGLPERFDPKTGENLRWTAVLGTETHATPVVARGRVLIGTNNGDPRDPKHEGDRGVLMCLDEAEGRLLWQLVVPKRFEDIYFDWPNSGICSPPTIEGDRVYVVDNRGCVLCLDLDGLADGNDGPFQHEEVYYAPQAANDLAQGAPAAMTPHGTLIPDAPPPNRIELGPLDADILWLFDLSSGAGIWSHDSAHSGVLIRGNHLYLNTGNGVDNKHRRILRPGAPSLVVLDKRTGRLLARDREPIGPDIFHSTWAPPAMAPLEGADRIFLAAGNGRIYAFEPLAGAEGDAPSALPSEPGAVAALRKVWEFDFDPAAPKTGVHRYYHNKSEGPSNFFGAPVVDEGCLYVAGGGDLWWGKNAAWLKCLDLKPEGPALRWSYPVVRHTFSTPAVSAGMAFVSDCSQNLHCVDAATGQALWTHELTGETWASPLVADGRVYVGTRRGVFHVLAAAREKRVLFEANLGSPISATAVAANGTLYVATMNRLYAAATRR
ncbi:MAG TPA: PQQ-binding-like beta-propeller repeat protein [Verrucomicrobiota bacterium]|nr:PQQ-binding-like beta-propeller repeat protein [Verrucomicrobiota bacterium]HNU51046.1 PQQ-binding-like beta-propeller repeat protein [Verrucomicrobiota bacterium]